MDKHNQISIKINGKEPRVKQEKQEKETGFVESEKTLTLVETDEVAAAQEEEEDDLSWVLPDETLNQNTSKEREIPVIPIEDLRNTKSSNKIPYFPKKSKRKGVQLFSVKQFVVSILLAIVLGVGFGFMILKVVGDVNAVPAGTETPTGQTEKTPTPEQKQENPPASNPVAIELETLSTGVVQGGKFSTADSAATTVNDIKSKGFAATAVEIDGAFYVIAGIGSEQGAVGGIKKVYEGSFPDFFTKTIEVQGGSFTSAGKADSDAIHVSLPVFKELLGIGSQAFGAGTITDAQGQSLSKQLTAVKEIKKENLPAELKDFHVELENTINYLLAFQQGGDQKVLWQSQQSLLNAYKNYTVWVSGLS